MSLKYKIDINWKDIQKGIPYKPTKESAANDLADVFVTASTTLAEEVTQDFADDNTRLKFILTIKPPYPKLEYYSTFTVKSNQAFDRKKLQLNQELLAALASAQEKLALQFGLELEMFPNNNGQNILQFRNISPIQRARFDVELNKQLPGIFNDVCNVLGYEFAIAHSNLPQHKITPFKMEPRPN